MKKKPTFFGFFFAFLLGGVLFGSLLLAPAIAQTAATGTVSGAGSIDPFLQSEIDQDNAQIETLNQQIAGYQAQLQQIGADKKTLQAAINSLDLQKSKIQAQVSIIETQIGITQLQIRQIGGQISDTQTSIANDQKALAAYLRALQKDDDQPLIMAALSSRTLSDLWSDVTANLQVQRSVQNDFLSLQDQQNSLANSRSASEEKQATLTEQEQSLASQQKALASTVSAKSQLLAQTNAQESTYQKLLAAAEAQAKSFSAFVQNAGGATLVGSQTICDSWGCYYNQRDSAWGNDKLDGTQYTLASDGCLVTAMAMVMTHYGYRNVTPVTINSDPGNFAAYYPAYLLVSISVDGVTATRKTTAIDTTLAGGDPVIVGIHAYGGTHYVVLVSGSKGSYRMRDPYIANGNDVSFTQNYSLKSIFAIAKVVIGS